MKHLKHIIFTIMTLISIHEIIAQQDPSFTLYRYNMNIINPAYAGIKDQTEININFRSQWVNLEGGPETQALSLGLPMNEKVGLGLSIINDNIFVLNQTDAYVDFSYKVQLAKHTNLYMGLKAGGTFIDIDLNKLGVSDDPVFMENVNQFNPNLGVGFLLKGLRYYVSLSAPTLLKSKRYEKDGIVVTDATDKLHAYLGGGYIFTLSESVDFIPSVMGRLVSGAPISLDITSTLDFYNVMELGISYRLNESISTIGLFKIVDWINFGYAYESTTTDVKDYSRGSHEVLLRFKF